MKRNKNKNAALEKRNMFNNWLTANGVQWIDVASYGSMLMPVNKTATIEAGDLNYEGFWVSRRGGQWFVEDQHGQEILSGKEILMYYLKQIDAVNDAEKIQKAAREQRESHQAEKAKKALLVEEADAQRTRDEKKKIDAAEAIELPAFSPSPSKGNVKEIHEILKHAGEGIWLTPYKVEKLVENITVTNKNSLRSTVLHGLQSLRHEGRARARHKGIRQEFRATTNIEFTERQAVLETLVEDLHEDVREIVVMNSLPVLVQVSLVAFIVVCTAATAFILRSFG